MRREGRGGIGRGGSNSNNFAGGSAALAGVCPLLSTILVQPRSTNRPADTNN